MTGGTETGIGDFIYNKDLILNVERYFTKLRLFCLGLKRSILDPYKTWQYWIFILSVSRDESVVSSIILKFEV